MYYDSLIYVILEQIETKTSAYKLNDGPAAMAATATLGNDTRHIHWTAYYCPTIVKFSVTSSGLFYKLTPFPHLQPMSDVIHVKYVVHAASLSEPIPLLYMSTATIQSA